MSLTLLADEQWLRSNEAALREMFPETWTHGLNVLAIGYRLKLLGVDWRSDADLLDCLTSLTRIGIVEVGRFDDGELFRRGRALDQ